MSRPGVIATSFADTVTDTAILLGLLATPEVGFFFAPTTSLSVTNGELSFGGVDSAKISGALHTV